MAFDYKLTAKEEARKEAVQAKIRSDLEALNLTCDMEALLELPSIRLCIISEGAGLPDNYLEEVKRIPAVAEQVRRAEVARQLSDRTSPLHADISKLPATSRMTLGHELLAQKKATEEAQPKKQMSATEEAQAIAWISTLPPAARVSAGRRLGLC